MRTAVSMYFTAFSSLFVPELISHFLNTNLHLCGGSVYLIFKPIKESKLEGDFYSLSESAIFFFSETLVRSITKVGLTLPMSSPVLCQTWAYIRQVSCLSTFGSLEILQSLFSFSKTWCKNCFFSDYMKTKPFSFRTWTWWASVNWPGITWIIWFRLSSSWTKGKRFISIYFQKLSNLILT